MQIITPKDSLDILFDSSEARRSVFLGGGMGKPWRKELIKLLSDSDIIIVDPTVEDWDESVGKESVDNLKYLQQVSWEQNAIQYSDIKVFHFDETSIAPVSLFELGTTIRDDVIIHLDGDYQKAAYLSVAASIHNIPVVATVKELSVLISIFVLRQ